MVYTGKGAAKINLAIDILSKRADGYHEVSMIMQSVSLYDKLSINTTKGDIIKLTTNSNNIPIDESNIVYKAAAYLKKKYNIKYGADIHIEKNIPIEAGLAGGSTDGATALKLLNKAWKLELTKSELLEAGKKLGADVPFCIEGGAALAQGIGEKLTSIPSIKGCYILLVKPNIGISTKYIYENLKLDKIKKRPDIDEIIKAIKNNDIANVTSNMCNVLETVALNKYPLIDELKKQLIDLGALGSLMSGSGSTVFGIFEDKQSAYNACDKINNFANEVFVVKSVYGGEYDG